MAGVRTWQEKARLEFLGGRGTELLTSGTGAQKVWLGFWDKAETHLAKLASRWSDTEQLKDLRLRSWGCSKPSLQIGVGSRRLQVDPQGPIGVGGGGRGREGTRHISFFCQNTVQR